MVDWCVFVCSGLLGLLMLVVVVDRFVFDYCLFVVLDGC